MEIAKCVNNVKVTWAFSSIIYLSSLYGNQNVFESSTDLQLYKFSRLTVGAAGAQPEKASALSVT